MFERDGLVLEDTPAGYVLYRRGSENPPALTAAELRWLIVIAGPAALPQGPTPAQRLAQRGGSVSESQAPAGKPQHRYVVESPLFGDEDDDPAD